MKKIFIKLAFFLILISLSAIWIFSFADGYTDHSYLRFTTPNQSSLILGNSKAAQCLIPEDFNRVLNRKDIFNYSFNTFTSPFGKIYFESIKLKLDTSAKNGIFIVTYDAWSLGSKTEEPNDSNNFRELKGSLTNCFVSLNPNVPYLLQFYEKKNIDILREGQRRTFLHKDGWLEVTLKMDSLEVDNRIKNNIKHYQKIYTPFWKFSTLRFKYFAKTIEFLKEYGKVFVVRLPVRPEFLKMENDIISNLSEKVDSLTTSQKVLHLNFSDSSKNYKYTDGLHLWKESGHLISIKIAKQILNKTNSDLIYE